jgi:hypothetical protein
VAAERLCELPAESIVFETVSIQSLASGIHAAEDAADAGHPMAEEYSGRNRPALKQIGHWQIQQVSIRRRRSWHGVTLAASSTPVVALTQNCGRSAGVRTE